MHHYRQALMRMRQGDSDRDIGRSRLMNRKKPVGLFSRRANLVLPDLINRAVAASNNAAAIVSLAKKA